MYQSVNAHFQATTRWSGRAPTTSRWTSSWWTTRAWPRATGTATCASVRRMSVTTLMRSQWIMHFGWSLQLLLWYSETVAGAVEMKKLERKEKVKPTVFETQPVHSNVHIIIIRLWFIQGRWIKTILLLFQSVKLVHSNARVKLHPLHTAQNMPKLSGSKSRDARENLMHNS